MSTPLARVEPVAMRAASPVNGAATARLTRLQKAAIVVRFLLSEGADIPLTDLPESMQARLTTQIGAMRYVDRTTLADVVEEFTDEVEAMGLTFPRGVIGALSALDGRISPQTAARLRKAAGVRQFGDPWDQVCKAGSADLAPIIEAESNEVAAVVLSKLDVTHAAEILGLIPGHKARQITYEMSCTAAVTPDAVDRIGLALAAQLHDRPETAFDDTPVERVGAILNSSRAATRDDVLTGLDETDECFANLVRRAIFTFAHIPGRLDPLDVAKLTRAVDHSVLVTALAAASESEEFRATAEFILDSMSKRMADALREAMQDSDKVSQAAGETAMTEVINVIRKLEADGEIELITPGEAEEE